MSNHNELLSAGWGLAGMIAGHFPRGAAGNDRCGSGGAASAFPLAGQPGTGPGPEGTRVGGRPRQTPGAMGGVGAAGPNPAGDRHGQEPLAGPGTPPASPTVDLHACKCDYEVRWYDPRKGGPLQSGSVTTLTGGGKDLVEVGQPPSEPQRDWVVLIRPARQGTPLVKIR